MKNLDFQLSRKKWCLRRENRKKFVDNERSVLNKKNNSVCVLFVCCNSFDLFNKCLEYLEKESNQSFDILVVDNSTNEENINLFHNIGIKNKKVSILKPIDNIWWSWWFSIWMEYIIEKGYDKLIIFEDDIIPIDENLITEMIKISDDKSIVKNSYVNIPDCECRVFHLVLYPMSIVKKIWVSDPRFFLKCDDADFEIRLKKHKPKTKFTWKYLFHPNLKCDWWKNWVFAFSVRNELFLLQNNFSIWLMIKYIFEQFLYIRYGISKLFIEKNLWVLKVYFWGISDYILWFIGYRYNLKLLNKYRWINISKLNLITQESEIQKFSEKVFNKYYLYLKFVHYEWLLWKFKFSKKFLDFKNWIIAWWILCPLYPLFMLFKRIVFLEEYFYWKETVKYEEFHNSKYLITLLEICISFLISIVIWIPVLIVLFLKYLLTYLASLLKR